MQNIKMSDVKYVTLVLTMCRILAIRDGIHSRGMEDLAFRRSQISRQENNPSYLREIEKHIKILYPFQE